MGSCAEGYAVPAKAKTGPSPCFLWQSMQAPPGCMFGDSASPRVQCTPLEQVTGVSYGLTTGPDPPVPESHVAGIPAATQSPSSCTSSGVAGVAGFGGIGRTGFCIRPSDITAFVCAGSVAEAAARSSAVTSCMGTSVARGVE